MHCPATPGGMPSAPGTGRAKRVASRYITAPAFRVIWPALPPGAQAYYARKHPLMGTDSHFISVAVRRLYEHGLTEQSHRAARTVLEKKIS